MGWDALAGELSACSGTVEGGKRHSPFDDDLFPDSLATGTD